MRYKAHNPSLNVIFLYYSISLMLILTAHYISLSSEIKHNSIHVTENRFKDIYYNSKNLIYVNDDSLVSIAHSNAALEWHSYQLILENPQGQHFYEKHMLSDTLKSGINFNLPSQSFFELNPHIPYKYIVDDKKLVGWMKLNNNYKLVVTLYHEPERYETTSLVFWLPTVLVVMFLLAGFYIYIRRTQLWHHTIDYSFSMTTPDTSIHKFNTYQPLKFEQASVGGEFTQLAHALSRANHKLYSKKIRIDALVSRLERLVSHAPLPIAFMNKEGKITFANERFSYVFMISLQKKSDLFLQNLIMPVDEASKKVIENISEQNLACSIDVNHLNTEQTYQLHLMPWFSTYGQLQGFTITLNDITPLNSKIESSVKLVNKQAKQIEDFEHLWSVMGHELRTPLAGIIGMLELLSVGNLNPEQKETFETLENTSEAMLFMLNDMLDLAKLDAGKLQISLEKTDVLQLCRNVCDLMTGNARRHGIDLLFYFDADAVRFIKTDASRLRQILLNLIGNAIKFTQSGYVALVVSIKDSTNQTMQPSDESKSIDNNVITQSDMASICLNDSQDIMYFEVIDTGIGINEEEQKKLFSFFNQANSDISKKFGGTGLGLAISRNFSNLLGGEVVVESQVGVGSNFQLQLPVSKDYKQPTYQLDVDLSHICMVVVTKHEISKIHISNLFKKLKIACIIEVVNTTQSDVFDDCVENINHQLQEEKYTKLMPIIFIDYGILRYEFKSTLSLRGTSDNKNMINLLESQFAKINDFEKTPKVLVSMMPERSIGNLILEQFDSYMSKPVDPSYLASELARLSQKDNDNSRVSKLQDSFNKFMLDTVSDNIDNNEHADNFEQTYTNDEIKPTVLVAEDNPINRKVVAKILEKLGYPYILVSNGQEAIKALDEHREEIALILMDCRMPVLNGMEATKKIRANHFSVPIIALTANDTDEDRKACILVGMDNFMAKPIKQETLQEMLNLYSIR